MDKNIYKMKVTLKNSRPRIWRKFQVEGDYTVGELSRVIQIVMGWSNTRQHEFLIKKKSYTDPNFVPEIFIRNENNYTIGQLELKPGEKFEYIYDFKKYWKHEVKVESVTKPEKNIKYPQCLDGKKACPVEESDGIIEYYRDLIKLCDPEHQDYKEVKAKLPEGFNPDEFNVFEINKNLRKYKEEQSTCRVNNKNN